MAAAWVASFLEAVPAFHPALEEEGTCLGPFLPAAPYSQAIFDLEAVRAAVEGTAPNFWHRRQAYFDYSIF